MATKNEKGRNTNCKIGALVKSMVGVLRCHGDELVGKNMTVWAKGPLFPPTMAA
jgi:hypothetical protein